MNPFPFISVDESLFEIKKEELPLLRDVALDFNTGNPIIENKTFKIVTGNEALKSWIYKSIKIDRYEYEIYTDEFGSEVMSLIGKGYTKALTESELKRYIVEAIEYNPYIVTVETVDTSFKKDVLSAFIRVKSVYGSLEVRV